MRISLRRHAIRAGRVLSTDALAIAYASELLSEGARLELRDEPGRALSESEAVDAIREGRVVEVVS